MIFYHGEKYRRDRQLQRERKQDALTPKPDKKLRQLQLAPAPPVVVLPAISARPVSSPPLENPLVRELVNTFGVDESKARKLVSTKPDEVRKQIGAFSLRKVNITSNLAGWIIRAIEHGYFVPPAYFEAKRKAEETKSAQARRDQIAACSLCDATGFRMVTDGKTSGAKKCSHNGEIEARYTGL